MSYHVQADVGPDNFLEVKVRDRKFEVPFIVDLKEDWAEVKIKILNKTKLQNIFQEETDPEPPVRFTTSKPLPSDGPRGEEQPVVEEQGIGIYVIIGESQRNFIFK